jgi:hypothetical protein
VNKQNAGAASAAPVFELKPLKTADVFIMARLVGKLGVGTFLSSLDKETIEKITKMKDAPELMKDISTAAASVKIINIILANSDKVMPELMELLGHATGMSETEIMDLPAADFVDLLDAFFSRADTWDFFTRVSQLINMD